MLNGYTDVLSLHAADGWWSTDASAPKGMGQLTNELAAFPSLHAGWALWVALVVRRNTHSYWLRGLAWLHAAITATVVIGTGNHWILDVAVGWAVVIIAMWLVDPWFLDGRGPEEVRLAFHDQITDLPGDARTAHSESSRRESEPMARVEREQPQGCRRHYDNDG
jgi:hypothetical protein